MQKIKSCLLSVSGPILTSDEKFFLEKENPIGITLFKRNIQNKKQLKSLIQDIKETIGRDDVWIAIDQEGGRVCRLAPPAYRPYVSQAQIGELTSYDLRKKMAYLHACLICDDLQKLGFNVNYSPVMDTLCHTTTDALKNRCFSSNEKIVKSCAREMIQLYIKKGICPCIKHLPGHGKASVDPHLNLPVIEADLKDLEQDFYPFQQISNIAPLGMTAHIILKKMDNIPATLSKKIIHDIIREKIGFQGFLISDAIEMGALSGTMSERTQKCLKAGCDAVCYCRGILEENKAVAKASKVLDDVSLERFQKIKQIIINPKKIRNILQKEKEYQKLTKQTIIRQNDYDVVETLNKGN